MAKMCFWSKNTIEIKDKRRTGKVRNQDERAAWIWWKIRRWTTDDELSLQWNYLRAEGYWINKIMN